MPVIAGLRPLARSERFDTSGGVDRDHVGLVGAVAQLAVLAPADRPPPPSHFGGVALLPEPGLADALESLLGDELVELRQDRLLEVAIGVAPCGEAAFTRRDEPEPEAQEGVDDRVG